MSPYLRRLRAALGSDLLVIPSVSGIVFDDRGRILLVRQADSGEWTTPGGSIDPGEIPSDAVVREVHEETGLVVEPVRVLGVFGGPACRVKYPNGDCTEYVMTAFECVVRAGSLQATTDETSAAAYVGADELVRYPTSDWVRHVLPGLYARSPATRFEPAVWRPRGGIVKG